MADSPVLSADQIALLNGLRSKLPKAQILTFSYDPLVGLTSPTGPDGVTTYHVYDGLQRLKLVKDQNDNVIKQYHYHYKGQ